VVGFADHKSTAEVWYKLLNCGFHLPTAAGTDFMGNYASLRGPLGLNRVYAQVPAGPLKIHTWLNAIKAGRTFATNGPLLRFELGGREPGGNLHLENKAKLPFRAALRSIVPIDHLQIICNGSVARDLQLTGDHKSADASGTLDIAHSGWCILRAYADHAEYPILDLYPYATTSPVYIDVAGAAVRDQGAAQYFVAWVDRLIAAAQQSPSWNTDQEKQAVISLFNQAKDKFEELTR
jgi:hypothetical protein